MNDRPTAVELVNAVRHYLENELLPTLTDPRLKFQTLIAANVLSIAERELKTEEVDLTVELAVYAELRKHGGDPSTTTEMRAAVWTANALLCEKIRHGDYDQPEKFQALARRLRSVVERKLQTANPRYLAATHTTKGTKS
jgi:Domain of unknown function (DUF6285)